MVPPANAVAVVGLEDMVKIVIALTVGEVTLPDWQQVKFEFVAQLGIYQDYL